MKRALDTLKYSSIEYCILDVCELFREIVTDASDYLPYEYDRIPETEIEIRLRVAKAKEYLREIRETHESVIVISHSDVLWWILSSPSADGMLYGPRLENGEVYIL